MSEIMNSVEKIDNQVVVADKQLPTANPTMMLQTALEKGMHTDTIKNLMDLQERWEKNEARKAYMVAIASFKENPPKVIKDAINKQYGSKYSTLGNLVNTVNECLGSHSLHAHWEIDQKESTISVTCILAHSLGYSEKATMSGPPDTSGSKNPIQQIKSTITYLKGATFEAVTGVAAIDGTADDDGNSAITAISPEDAAKVKTELQRTNSNVKSFLSFVGADNVDTMTPARMDKGLKMIAKKAGKNGN